jgi:hypothetical protein
VSFSASQKKNTRDIVSKTNHKITNWGIYEEMTLSLMMYFCTNIENKIYRIRRVQ